ncbi:receptor expression-enhancing protein 5-like [Panonychus citri]|uniref:receptor expression-enhancing protein 5-like n=1 Tax=Panonychus citri TaxID=50023 RepID=UPI0023073F2B|nr:receptor expression-enhancing protein 5-like [Panonychus citri]
MTSQFLGRLDNVVDTVFSGSPVTQRVFNGLETVTRLEKRKIAKCFFILFAIYMTFGAFAELICNAVGFVYPAIQSLEALETHDSEDDRQWLTYWVVFAFFSVIEFFSDKIFYVFPVYYLAKLIFLVWCFWPTEQNGSIRIYNQIIRPYYLKKRSEKEEEKDAETGRKSISNQGEKQFYSRPGSIVETPVLTQAMVGTRIRSLLKDIKEKEKELDKEIVNKLDAVDENDDEDD